MNFEQAIEFQWKDFFISYSMAYNKQNKREGSLFLSPFRRISVKGDNYFTRLVIYHHANRIKHGISKEFETYPWSSYLSILSNKPTMLKRTEVLDWFGGKR